MTNHDSLISGARTLPRIQRTDRLRGMFTVAPVIAVIASTIAFVLANHYDYPPGQVTVALLGAVLAALWVARWLGQRTARQTQP